MITMMTRAAGGEHGAGQGALFARAGDGGARDVGLSVRQMYAALVARDEAFDGRFVVGVKSTGIFCRCTCPARKPLLKNVEFFADASAALFAGYRACLRCRPLEDVERARAAPAWLTGLKSRIDAAPNERMTWRDLKEMGLDSSTVRRAFQSHYGLTMAAYARSRRIGLAVAELRKGKSVTRAAMTAGYASESAAREAIDALLGSPRAGGERVTKHTLTARWIDTPLGAMLAVVDDDGLRILDFVDRRGLERHLVRVREKLGAVIVAGAHPTLDLVERELAAYFSGKAMIGGERSKLAALLKPGLGGTAFQQSVWAALRAIPPGQTRSYQQQAASIGKRDAVRAVARANGENFLSLIIPCHRVIGSDGSMTGYGGGVWRKQWLLEHERKHFA